MILGTFRAIRFMHAENSTPKLPLNSCRKSAIEQCQQNTPIPQHGAQMRPSFMRASCALHACSRTGRDRRLKEEAPLSLERVFFMRAAGAAPGES
jgi:hypothetical protein